MQASQFCGNLPCQPVAENLREFLENIVAERGGHIAYLDRKAPKAESRTTTYARLLERIENLAYSLLTPPFNTKAAGDDTARYGVLGLNSVDWVVAFNAAIFSNNLAVPLDKQLSEAEVRQLIKKARIKTLFLDASFKDLIKNFINNNDCALEQIILIGLEAEKKSDVAAFLQEIGVDESFVKNNGGIPQLHLLKTLERQGADSDADIKRRYANLQLKGEAACAIYFTSGTSAQSKGVMLSHFNHLYGITAVRDAEIVEEGGTALSVLPMHHIFENAAQYIFWQLDISVAVNCGLRYITYNLQNWPITIILCVPLLLENIQKQIITTIRKQGKLNLFNKMRNVSNFLLRYGIDVRSLLFKKVRTALSPQLRTFVVGAAALKSDCESFFNDLGFEALVGYGMTETAPIITANHSGATRSGSVGNLLPHFKLFLDKTNFAGDEGEICVQGPSVMLGYYENEAETALAETALPNQEGKYLRTGDVGRLDKDGYLYITGRVKSMIVLDSGKKVFPEELEALYTDIAGVKESFVFSLPNDKAQTELALCFVLDQDRDKSIDVAAAISEKLKEVETQIPVYKRPQYWFATENELVHTTTLKIKRQKNVEIIKQTLLAGRLALKDIHSKLVTLQE